MHYGSIAYPATEEYMPADQPEPLPDPVREPTIDIERAGRLLGIGRNAAYTAAARGDIPVIRLGPKRIRVPTARLLALLGIDAAS